MNDVTQSLNISFRNSMHLTITNNRSIRHISKPMVYKCIHIHAIHPEVTYMTDAIDFTIKEVKLIMHALQE